MRKLHLALDLGTTNTVAAIWNAELDNPQILHLKDICRDERSDSLIDDSFTIPSTVFLLEPAQVYRFPYNILFKKLQSKTGVKIGKAAIMANGGLFKENFVSSFKSYLGRGSYQFIGQLGEWKYNAELITELFLRELIHQIEISEKAKVNELTITVPVDFYEFYRARLHRICRRVGIHRIHTLDEPVAAALGYGLNVTDSKTMLVVDFGGGTLDCALIHTNEKGSEKGQCSVLAKEGAPIGGNVIDAWIVEMVCEHYGYDFAAFTREPDLAWWYRILLEEARRVKESLFNKEKEIFYLLPSAMMHQFAGRFFQHGKDARKPMVIDRDMFSRLLEDKGLYRHLDSVMRSLFISAGTKGITSEHVEEVIMIGGSTLLPGVYPFYEDMFGRDRVRAWQPFNAVAFGAAAYSAGKFFKKDIITHDYAIRTYNHKNHEPEYHVIVPGNTPFPTPSDFWKRRLVPTCALGEPESIFKLIVCEIGKKHGLHQEFVWDDKGRLHSLEEGAEARQLIVPLNEDNPTLGYLEPPHYPSEKAPRVEISFMVNEDKWLCTSVYDLKSQNMLIREKPVIRLK